MLTRIFYFSATGNSYSLAHKIGEKIGDVELISIPKVGAELSNIEGNKIGIIFPVYAYGLPRTVEDFIKRIKLKEEQYIFAVATCSGIPGNTLKKLSSLLKKSGSRLNAGFTVKESKHMFLSENAVMRFIVKIAGEQPLPAKERISEMVKIIKNNQNHSWEGSSPLANIFGGLIHKLAVQSFKKTGSDFWVNENCDTCKVCESICPRGNIRIVNNRPVWQEDCESCFACVQWCPNAAIQYKDESIGKDRSHNENVTLNDMLT